MSHARQVDDGYLMNGTAMAFRHTPQPLCQTRGLPRFPDGLVPILRHPWKGPRDPRVP